MNYLYQIRGLIVDTGALAGTPVIDYSRQVLSVPMAASFWPKAQRKQSDRGARLRVERRRGLQSLSSTVVFAHQPQFRIRATRSPDTVMARDSRKVKSTRA